MVSHKVKHGNTIPPETALCLIAAMRALMTEPTKSEPNRWKRRLHKKLLTFAIFCHHKLHLSSVSFVVVESHSFYQTVLETVFTYSSVIWYVFIGQYLLQRPHAALDSSCTYFCRFGLASSSIKYACHSPSRGGLSAKRLPSCGLQKCYDKRSKYSVFWIVLSFFLQ